MNLKKKKMKNNIDFKKIKFIARHNTWYDEGTEAILETTPSHDYPSGYFRGLVNGELDGEECGLDEFDWIDENGNCLNSNIPTIEFMHILGNWIVKDHSTGVMYNLMDNCVV